jgi:hypothetical protein
MRASCWHSSACCKYSETFFILNGRYWCVPPTQLRGELSQELTGIPVPGQLMVSLPVEESPRAHNRTGVEDHARRALLPR